MTIVEQVRDFLRHRKQAYLHVFDKESVHVTTVMRDLAKFCRASETTFHPDARLHAVLEGRREVYLRIANHLNLSSEELLKPYGKGNLDDNR